MTQSTKEVACPNVLNALYSHLNLITVKEIIWSAHFADMTYASLICESNKGKIPGQFMCIFVNVIIDTELAIQSQLRHDLTGDLFLD